MSRISPYDWGRVPILCTVLISVILATQFPSASAGAGIYRDDDHDGFNEVEGDCDDNNPNKFPGHGCVIPIDEISYVIDDVNALAAAGDITSGQASALLAKLQNAIDKIESNNINGAIGSLNAFIKQITAFMDSGKISPSVGNPLIADVKNIIDTLKMG